MNEEKKYLSKSQMTMYFRCGEQYRRRYLEKDIIPPAIALVRGSSFHQVARANNKAKLKSRVDLSVSDMSDVMSDEIDKGFSKGLSLTEEEATRSISSLKGETKDILMGVVPIFAEKSKPIFPRIVEFKQRLVIPKSEYDLVYVMDIETEDDKIIDYKFSAKKKNQSMADSDLGLTAYSLAFYAKNKRNPAKTIIQNFTGYITPKRREVKNDYLEIVSSRSSADYAALLRRMEEMTKALKAGIFPPAEVGSWGCSEKFCGYWRSGCPYINSERKAAAKAVE